MGEGLIKTLTFKRQAPKKSVFDHFVGLALKVLSNGNPRYQTIKKSQIETKKRGE